MTLESAAKPVRSIARSREPAASWHCTLSALRVERGPAKESGQVIACRRRKRLEAAQSGRRFRDRTVRLSATPDERLYPRGRPGP